MPLAADSAGVAVLGVDLAVGTLSRKVVDRRPGSSVAAADPVLDPVGGGHLASEQRRPRRRADGGRAVILGEPDAVVRKLVDVGLPADYLEDIGQGLLIALRIPRHDRARQDVVEQLRDVLDPYLPRMTEGAPHPEGARFVRLLVAGTPIGEADAED